MRLFHVSSKHVRPIESLDTLVAVVNLAPIVLLVLNLEVEHNPCLLICLISARRWINQAAIHLGSSWHEIVHFDYVVDSIVFEPFKIGCKTIF